MRRIKTQQVVTKTFEFKGLSNEDVCKELSSRFLEANGERVLEFSSTQEDVPRCCREIVKEFAATFKVKDGINFRAQVGVYGKDEGSLYSIAGIDVDLRLVAHFGNTNEKYEVRDGSGKQITVVNLRPGHFYVLGTPRVFPYSSRVWKNPKVRRIVSYQRFTIVIDAVGNVDDERIQEVVSSIADGALDLGEGIRENIEKLIS